MNSYAAPVGLETIVHNAQNGDAESLNKLILEVHKQIYGIALRFLSTPHDAEDACQEIIIRIIKNLHTFKGESKFRTWAYRVACNTLISIKSQKRDEQVMSFDEFAENIHDGMNDHDVSEQDQPDYQRLLEEIRIACTLAMLQCLDDDARVTYIVGEIFEMDHSEGAQILNISQVNYRKRLSRARSSVIKFMSDNCGLMNEANRCRCRKQVGKCLSKGCISRDNFMYAKEGDTNRQFSEALQFIRTLDEAQRAASLYRQIPLVAEDTQYLEWVRTAVANANQTQPPTATW